MTNDVVADTSFYICNLCNIKRKDLLLTYLEQYHFHAGNIILEKELSDVRNDIDRIRDKITKHNINFIELYRLEDFTSRTPEHIYNDGEYEAISIAIMLAHMGTLHCLILDDNGPKNFAQTQFKELRGKVHGTIGFIKNSYIEDHLISKENVLEHLKDIHQSFLTYQKNGGGDHRPCSLDQNFVDNTLIPMIDDLERVA